MNIEKFIKEKKRMCYYLAGGYCSRDCPLRMKFGTCNTDALITKNNIKKAMSIVEEWATVHPHKTRQDIFLEQWPKARIDTDGVLCACPINFVYNHPCFSEFNGSGCLDCRREFWGQEVE